MNTATLDPKTFGRVAVLLGGLSNSAGRPGASATERTATAQR